jgi:hypothetical protein
MSFSSARLRRRFFGGGSSPGPPDGIRRAGVGREPGREPRARQRVSTPSPRRGRRPCCAWWACPRDAFYWALYYPPVVYFRPDEFPAGPDWQGMVRQSIESYLRGDLQRAPNRAWASSALASRRPARRRTRALSRRGLFSSISARRGAARPNVFAHAGPGSGGLRPPPVLRCPRLRANRRVYWGE